MCFPSTTTVFSHGLREAVFMCSLTFTSAGHYWARWRLGSGAVMGTCERSGRLSRTHALGSVPKFVHSP